MLSEAQAIPDLIGFNTSKQRAVLRFTFKIWVWELLLTCCALTLLLTISTPLAEGDRPLGLHQRYAVSSENALASSVTEEAHEGRFARRSIFSFNFAPISDDKALRAQWLNRHAGAVLVLLAACGSIALSLGRSSYGIRTKQMMIASLWCVAAHLLGAFSTRSLMQWQAKGFKEFISLDIWLCAASVFLFLAIVALMKRQPASRWQYQHTAGSPWVYPGFILFCGLGWLWLLDWAARGHLDKQFIGIYQLDSLWLAFTLLTMVAAHHGQLLAGMSRFASCLDQIGNGKVSMPNGLMLTGLLVWIAIIVATGQLNVGNATQVKIYQRHAALLAELMRVPVWLALGWMTYRWVETGQRVSQGVFAAAALLATLMLGLKFDHDGGAMLAQTIAIIWIVCGVMQHSLARRYSVAASSLITASIAALGTAGAIKLAYFYAPRNRIDALALTFQGPLDFLSVIHWMLDAVPTFGFGIGNTPWCGYTQLTGLVAQCVRAGVPDQIQSDYVTVALIAVWGWFAALVLLAALLLWLWELMRHEPAVYAKGLNLNLLRLWIVTGFAVTSGVQIAISVAGTLGKMPLTGLAIPMLSLGGVGLASTALFAGLSINRFYLKTDETPG